MLKVFKYDLPIDNYSEISMPKDSQILSIQTQKENPVIWALVDPSAKMITRKFRFAGTGHPILHDKQELYHHGSFQMACGALVFHVFEVM